MNKRIVLSSSLTLLLTLLLLLCQAAQAQDRMPEETKRINRLIGLARVWGTVKYFHPYLAYRAIDWDKALVEAIPRVNTAKTPEEYRAAVNQMLAVLNDKSTRAEIESEPKKQTPPADMKAVRTENGLLIIDAAQIAKSASENSTLLRGFVSSINESLPNAKGVIFDWRSTSQFGEFESYYFDLLLRQTLTGMLDSTIVLGSSRHRMHNGYPTQTASGASFYYSALVSIAPQTIAGRGKTNPPPIAFIVNQNSPPFSEMLTGLQAANRATVIQEGEQPLESSSATFTIELPDKVKARVRTQELINPDGSLELQPDATVAKSATGDAALNEAMKAVQENRTTKGQNRTSQPPPLQISEKDKPYADMQFPNVEYRLLALFRFWNVVNYFYPYKKLIADTWETVLQRFIPKFEANKDATDYQLTVFELATEMHDSHAVVRNANFAAAKLYGFQVPAVMGYIENQSVVVKVLDDKAPVKIGDVVLAVDGTSIEKRREFLSRYVAASTPQSLMLRLNALLLNGAKNSIAKLRVRSPNGQERDVELARSISPGDPKFYAAIDRSGPIIKLLPDGYGYVDLGRLEVGEVDKMFDTIKDAPAVIFDMRGYPTGSAWEIAPRLTEKKNVVAALFSRSIMEPEGLRTPDFAALAQYSFAQKLMEPKGRIYKGKVVMLINEEAISRSEHAALFFEAATDVTFIGTPTQGANGDITLMVLPGNLPISFSGHDVRHGDGRQLQRLGIQPTIKAAPTIRGMIEGRDEVLEAAIKYLQQNLKR